MSSETPKTEHALLLHGILPQSRVAIEQWELALRQNAGGFLILRASDGRRDGIEAVYCSERFQQHARLLAGG